MATTPQEALADIWITSNREAGIGEFDDETELHEAELLIAELRKRGFDVEEDWISVNDRLPDMDDLVFVRMPSGKGGHSFAPGARVDGGYDDKGEFYWLWAIGRWPVNPDKSAGWNDIEADDDYEVTHWRPMFSAPVPVGDET